MTVRRAHPLPPLLSAIDTARQAYVDDDDDDKGKGKGLLSKALALAKEHAVAEVVAADGDGEGYDASVLSAATRFVEAEGLQEAVQTRLATLPILDLITKAKIQVKAARTSTVVAAMIQLLEAKIRENAGGCTAVSEGSAFLFFLVGVLLPLLDFKIPFPRVFVACLLRRLFRRWWCRW